MAYIVGVDVGGTTIKFGFFDDHAELLEKFSIETVITHEPQDLLDMIASTIEQKIPLEDLLGIGIGVPGPVINGVVQGAVNLDWKIVDVKGYFQLRLPGVNVLVHNDANIAALGEASFGERPYRNMVLITLGTGVGGGVILEGKIWSGTHGVGGEIGHMRVSEDGILCNCGLKGCLETIASATGIKRRAKHYLERSEPSILTEPFSAKAIFEAAKQGDVLALKVIEDLSETLAKALQNLAVVLDPEAFVLGGGVSHAGEFLRAKVEEKFALMAFGQQAKNIQITLASLGNDAGIYGCLKAVLDA